MRSPPPGMRNVPKYFGVARPCSLESREVGWCESGFRAAVANARLRSAGLDVRVASQEDFKVEALCWTCTCVSGDFRTSIEQSYASSVSNLAHEHTTAVLMWAFITYRAEGARLPMLVW